MSNTPMLTNQPNAVKLWGKKTYLQLTQKSIFGVFMNTGVIYFAEELMGKRAGRGDSYTLDYVGALKGTPTGEGENASQNSEGLDISAMQMQMGLTRKVVDFPADATIEQQRTNINFNSTARDRLEQYMTTIFDASLFQQAAGAAPTSLRVDGVNFVGANKLQHVFGHNQIIAPTSDRILRPNGKATDEALTSDDTFSLTMLDYHQEANEMSDYPMMPLADGSFIVVLSPEQVNQIKHDTKAPIQWYNNQLAAINGGATNWLDETFKNKYICLGKYGNYWIYGHKRVAHGVHSSTNILLPNVRRAVIFGRDALSFASPFGGRPTDKSTPIDFFTDDKDVGYCKLLEARSVFGVKKMSPTGHQDIGTFVISTYAASNLV